MLDMDLKTTTSPRILSPNWPMYVNQPPIPHRPQDPTAMNLAVNTIFSRIRVNLSLLPQATDPNILELVHVLHR